jgi:hypothetical protein
VLQDTLNSRRRYPVIGSVGIPDLLPQAFTLPDVIPPLLKYRSPAPAGQVARSLCHFFLFDSYFESCWTHPARAVSYVRRFWGALTPDFSMYVGWPLAMQIWNVYRSRWVGRFWQEQGLRVVPTVNWSMPASYSWCFAGIPTQQVVAVGVPDLRRSVTRILFCLGYRRMLHELDPLAVLVYGELPFYCSRAVEFPPDVAAMRARITAR